MKLQGVPGWKVDLADVARGPARALDLVHVAHVAMPIHKRTQRIRFRAKIASKMKQNIFDKLFFLKSS